MEQWMVWIADEDFKGISATERARSWNCLCMLNDNIQMMHGCKWNIQICCPEVDMSSRGRSPSDDISTEGQHI